MILTSDAFEMFCMAKQSKRVSASTRMLYNYAMRFWQQRWGDLPLADVTANQVRTFLVWLIGEDESPGAPAAPLTEEGERLSGSTAHIIFRNLRTFWTWVEREQLVNRSPMINVEAPMVEKKVPDCLTEDEALNLLASVKRNGDRNSFRDYVIHLFFLATAVRLFELSNLTLDNVDLKIGYAKVYGKRRTERMVGLGKDLPLEIKRYLLKHRHAQPNERALFVNERGQRLGKRGIQVIITRDLKKYLGRDLNRTGPHTYRHTSITFRLRQTRDLKGTSIFAGHSDARVTEGYSHLAFEDVFTDGQGQPYSPTDSLLRKGHRPKKGDSLRDSNPKPTTNLNP